MVQALKAKEVDLTWSTPLPSIPELKGLESQGITTLVQPGTGAERYVFNGDHKQVPLFGDKDLRMALSLAVDRKTIVDKLLFGLTTIARGDWDGQHLAAPAKPEGAANLPPRTGHRRIIHGAALVKS